MNDIPASTATGAEARYTRSYSQKRRDMVSGYLYISPFYILFAVFGVFPIFFTFYLSFFKWDGLGDMTAVGMRNFELLVTDDKFWKAVTNTILLGLMGTLPQLFVALPLAFLLNSAFVRFRGLFQTLYFMPNITSIVAVAIVFSTIFTNTDYGLANYLIQLFGGKGLIWGSHEWGVKIAVAFMVFWRWTGYNAVIYLAGLQSIPYELYEAARIDGASWFRQLRHISVPMLRPFIMFTVVISTIGALQLFTEPYVYLGRGFGDQGMTIVMYLFRYAFINYNMGYASAAAVLLFFMVVTFSVLNTWLVSRRNRT